MIVNEDQCDKGSIVTSKNFRIAYLKQSLDITDLNISLLEYTENAIKEKNSLIPHLGILQTKYEHIGGYSLQHKAEAVLSGLGFLVNRFNDKFASFSGSWQMRAWLANCLLQTQIYYFLMNRQTTLMFLQ